MRVLSRLHGAFSEFKFAGYVIWVKISSIRGPRKDLRAGGYNLRYPESPIQLN